MTDQPLEEPVRPAAASSTEDSDRALAAVAHLFGWISGTIILVVAQQRSAWLRFHALQALVVDLALTAVMTLVGIVFGMGFPLLMMVAMVMGFATGAEEPNPGPFIAVPFLMFGVMMPCITVLALVPWGLRLYAILQAAGGKVYAYPLIGRWLKYQD